VFDASADDQVDMRLRLRPGRGQSQQVTRPIAGALLAFLLLASFVATRAGADTQSQLDAAKAELSRLDSEITSQNKQLGVLQSQLDALAGRIDKAQTRFQLTQQQAMQLRDQMEVAEARYRVIRNRLDERAANAYMDGAGSSLDVVLGATSLQDFTDRLEFLDSVTQSDADLANRAQHLADQIHQREVALNQVLQKEADAVRVLQSQQDDLNLKFKKVQSIRASLSHKKHEAAGLVAKLGKKLKAEELAAAMAAQQAQAGAGQVFNIGSNPLHICPVDQPHAFTDSFGAPRYTTSPPHPHAGIDIMAPRGTPIRATFDGVAEASPNGLGGNAVIVRGADGYTYNAHLDSYGTLGPVSTGTIVGYVGDTGDAQGGPTHDHFEWHPNAIPTNPYRSPYGYTEINGAIDSYPYLLQVC
jgi:peptidoglycan LD-endopeptidase LytH